MRVILRVNLVWRPVLPEAALQLSSYSNHCKWTVWSNPTHLLQSAPLQTHVLHHSKQQWLCHDPCPASLGLLKPSSNSLKAELDALQGVITIVVACCGPCLGSHLPSSHPTHPLLRITQASCWFFCSSFNPCL